MFRKSVLASFILVLAFIVCMGPTTACAQSEQDELLRVTLPNDVGIELLGKSVLYSFYYQRMVNKALGLEIGLSALGGSSGDDDLDDTSSLVFVPFGAKFYLIPKNGSIFLAAGGVYLSGSTDTGPFDESDDGTYAYAGLGFELRQPGGFLFRGQSYALMADGSFFIWPGLSLGFAF